MNGLGSARGGRKPGQAIEWEIVRALEPDDLALLTNPPLMGTTTPTIAKLRHSHHALARELARGAKDIEAGLIAGFSSSRISILKKDPVFRELLEHYSTQRDIVQVDVLERMTALGLDSLEELKARLEENPDMLSARELMELTNLMLVQGRSMPGARTGGAGGGGSNIAGAALPAVTVQVQFVQAEHRPLIEAERK